MNNITLVPDPREHGGTLILSPHSDDAALSLGGIIQKKILKQPVTLMTIFGRSNYLRETAFQEDWKEVTQQRADEDQAYATLAGLHLKFLELPDAGLRLGSSFEAIFSDQPQTNVPVPPELSTALQAALDEVNPMFLIVPIGLGWHHDHLLVRQLAGELAEQRGIIIVYFEDLPYAAEYSEEAILEHAQAVGPELRCTCIRITSEIAAKLDALQLYKSQIGPEVLQAVSDYATRWDESQAFERVWSSVFPLKLLEGNSV